MASLFANSRDGTPNQMYKTTKLLPVKLFRDGNWNVLNTRDKTKTWQFILLITFVAASLFANSRDGTPNQMYKTTKLLPVKLFRDGNWNFLNTRDKTKTCQFILLVSYTRT